MKKFLLILVLFFMITPTQQSFAEGMVLQAGVSLSDQVPQGFFGTWKIESVMVYSNNKKLFNQVTTDFWNLSKVGDVITLTNPLSGAEASVTVEDVKGNQIKFSHEISKNNAKMIETPTLTLDGENFYGTDRIVLEKYKSGKKISTDIVEYSIRAEKISGNSAKSIFMSEI